MLGDFLREHGMITILLILVIIVAFNVGLIIQHKEIRGKSSSWHSLSKSASILRDPWKEENEQWQELSNQVSALKEKQKDHSE
jgi:hypothetical protein